MSRTTVQCLQAILATLMVTGLDAQAATLRPNHITQDEMNAVVEKHYAAWKKYYVRELKGTNPAQKFIEFDRGPKTVSEAHGYGMVIAAQMSDRADFDAFYWYYKDHPSTSGRRLMAWKQAMKYGKMIDVDGVDSATDGDLGIAYALLSAHSQWGSAGDINYLTEALGILDDILAYDVNPGDFSLLLGDWAARRTITATRPSDFMTDHVIAFAMFDTAHSYEWAKVYDRITTIVQDQFRNGSRETGLMPDFMSRSGGVFVPVEGTYLESMYDGDFSYNACRTPWRLAMSYISYGREELLPALLAQNAWIRKSTGHSPAKIRSGYYVRNGRNGSPFSSEEDLSFTAPFAINAMIAAPTRESQDWLNKLWTALTGGRFGVKNGYYGDAIRMQVLLTVSGKWRAVSR